MSGLAGKPAGNLLGRPALGEAREDRWRRPASRSRRDPDQRRAVLMGIGGQVVKDSFLHRATDDGARSCDLPEASGNFTPFFNGDLFVLESHGNTSIKCCTSFVNLGSPGEVEVRHQRHPNSSSDGLPFSYLGVPAAAGMSDCYESMSRTPIRDG